MGGKATGEKKFLAYWGQDIANQIAGLTENVVHTAGSLRRGKPLIKDVDLATCADLTILSGRILKHWGKKATLISAGEQKASFIIEDIQTDIYAMRKEYAGAMMLFLTGSQMFNIIMRSQAKKLGFKLNQYGLWKGEKMVAGSREEDIFKAIGMRYHKPEERNK